MNRRWTTVDHETLLALKQDGKSNGQIGRVFNVSAKAIDGQLRSIRLARPDQSVVSLPYNFRGRANPWTDQQKALLWQLREVEGLPWPEVAERCGHPKGSCQTCLSAMRRDRLNGVTRSGPDRTSVARPRKMFLRAPADLVMPPALPPSARTMRTAILVADAELRARCEVLGLTGGLLGDPLPGRSALDQRLSEASGITLATGPMR